MREVAIINPIKMAAILIPSGRCTMLEKVVYANTREINRNPQRIQLVQNEIVTAIAAELISTKTPVA